MITFWSYDWEYWNLYHKVTFDIFNKIIHVNNGVTELDWKVDVYSAWKEWVRLENHKGNAAIPPAIRAVGGDNIASDGSRKLGATFFLINGWRIKPWGGNYRLSILGNVYTEEGEPIYIPVDGNYKIIIEQTLSSLVELVTLDSGNTPPSGILCPTAERIAQAVWDRAALSSIGTGTFGAHVNMIKASSDLRLTELLSIQSKVDIATALIRTLTKFETNRTRVDQVEKRLYVYDDDGITILRSFDLKDFTGGASITQIAERVPRS